MAEPEPEPEPLPLPEPEPVVIQEREPEPKKELLEELPKRKPGTPVRLDEGRIIALRKANPPRSYKWIAEDMGVSEATIFNRCKKLTEEGRL